MPSPQLKKRLPTGADILVLTREQVAGHILIDMNAEAASYYHGEANYSQNQRNYVNWVRDEYQSNDVDDLFNAAWRWLIEQQYLAEDTRQVVGNGWYRLTAKGRTVKTLDDLHLPRVPRDMNPGPVPNFHSLTRGPLVKHLAVLWEEAAADYAGQAWLSTVIMLGSLLEAALLAKCQEGDAIAKASASAPKSKGVAKDYEWWSLSDFLAVAEENNWIHQSRNDFADILRDYRNMVHPYNAYRRNYRVDRSMATICWEVVKAALADLGVKD